MLTLWTFSFNAPNCKFKHAEYIFEFEGVAYRLIRGTVEETDKLLTISDDSSQKSTDECFERTRRLLDYLSWELNTGIQFLGGVGRGFIKDKEKLETALVGAFHSRNLRSIIVGIARIPNVSNDNQRFALNLWNEAESSNSPFLAFINYWSIIELSPPNSKEKGVAHKPRAIEWINNLSENRILGLSEFKKNLKSKYNYENDVGKFLYDEGRNAIAHVTKRGHFRRYDSESRDKIYELKIVMKAIAKYYIKNELNLDQYPQPLNILKTKKQTRAYKYLKLK